MDVSLCCYSIYTGVWFLYKCTMNINAIRLRREKCVRTFYRFSGGDSKACWRRRWYSFYPLEFAVIFWWYPQINEYCWIISHHHKLVFHIVLNANKRILHSHTRTMLLLFSLRRWLCVSCVHKPTHLSTHSHCWTSALSTVCTERDHNFYNQSTR